MKSNRVARKKKCVRLSTFSRTVNINFDFVDVIASDCCFTRIFTVENYSAKMGNIVPAIKLNFIANKMALCCCTTLTTVCVLGSGKVITNFLL